MEPQHFESLYPPQARFEEIEKLLSYVKSGNSAQLISLPGVGRSNLMGMLAYNREARELHLKEAESTYHFVMMNFSEIKKRPLIDATKYIFLELVDSLKERKRDEQYDYANKIFQDSLKSNDELVLFQGLKKTIDYLSLEKELSVVFLFDRFEDYIPMLEPQFFSNLRVLRDRAKYKFSAVFPLNRPLEDSVGPDMLTDYYEFIVGNIVYIPVEDERVLNFRLDFLEKQSGKKLDRGIREEIIKLTGGHGKLSRIGVEAYLSEEAKGDLADFLLSKNRVIAVIEEVWNALTPFEQKLIKESKASESSSLIAIGLVKNNRITIPLVEIYAKREENTDAKITYDETTNEIKKESLILSEGLTSSEFKLLKYLVINEGKILERNDIISNVWSELSSTAGVSEQALDQLIFRVRKKIEENPNSPTHIQTVKGRGFKFIT